MKYRNDTIAALATGKGGGAIAVIRVSGPEAVAVADKIFTPRNGAKLSDAAGYTVHFGEIYAPGGETVDQVLITVFRAPHSYTGEDSVEISCHASTYITARILQLLSDNGCRAATAGEFTTRAFLAGKLDLAQAEAVADLIASQDRAQHTLAMEQMRGGVSSALAELKDELTELAALLELELDFGEEEVEFADRRHLSELAGKISAETDRLAGSFALGNAIKEGVPVAIVGRPNAGKSTLLNALVGDDRAMVSDIAGTTRDRIEERVNIGGTGFRFIDTAGLRSTEDVLEQMGIDRALEAVRKARIVLLVVDASEAESATEQAKELQLSDGQRLCVVINKVDVFSSLGERAEIKISAKTGSGLDELRDWLTAATDIEALWDDRAVVSNARHYEALTHARRALERVSSGLSGGLSADLLAEDLREVLHHLGTITGSVTSDEILQTIFSKFCIGK